MFINIKGEKGNFEEKVTNTSIIGFELVRNTPYLFIATQEELLFYKINKGFQVQKLSGGHQGPVTGLFYLDFKRIHGSNHKASSRLLSIGDDNTIRVWDSVDQTEMACFPCPPDTEVLCMEYLTKFGLLVTGHENGDLYMWDIEIGTRIKLKNKNKTNESVVCLCQLSNINMDFLFVSG
jgi:WD40 repeat protein